MSVKPVTFYEVECDEPGCGARTGDDGEFAAWADHGQAHDDWVNNDGVILDDGKAYCDKHSKGKVCDHCGETRDTEDDGDGDRICAQCVTAEATS